jgi:hypothetical protein
MRFWRIINAKNDALKLDYSAFEDPSAILTLRIFHSFEFVICF